MSTQTHSIWDSTGAQITLWSVLILIVIALAWNFVW